MKAVIPPRWECFRLSTPGDKWSFFASRASAYSCGEGRLWTVALSESAEVATDASEPAVRTTAFRDVLRAILESHLPCTANHV